MAETDSTDGCADGITGEKVGAVGLAADEADARLLLRALARLQKVVTKPHEQTFRKDCGLGGEAFARALATALRHGWIDKDDDGRIAASRQGRLVAGWSALAALPLRSALRRGRLKGPTSVDFDAQALKPFTEASDVEYRDLRLAVSVMWIAAQMSALRESAPADHAPLGAAGSTVMAVAMMNRECTTAVRQSLSAARRAARKRRGRMLDPAVLPQLAGVAGQTATLEDVSDMTVDATESWLYAASSLPPGGAWPAKADRFAKQALTRCSLQRGLNDLWQQGLWEGWNFDAREERSYWAPDDPDFALLFDAWQTRLRSNVFQYASLVIAAWPHMTAESRRAAALPLSVVRADGGRGHSARRLVVGPPSLTDGPPAYCLEREALTGSYLADFLKRPLPKQPDLDCELLLKAWHVLADLAEALVATANFDDFATLAATSRSALSIRLSDVIDVLEWSLGCSQPTVENIVEFLTWRPKAYKGLWACPLVPTPGGDEVCLARPVLQCSNLIRRAEIWLQNGGLNDDLSSGARGDAYEAGLRAKCAAEIAGNALLTDAGCSPHAIKKTQDFDEQVDLLIQIGDLLLACEVKCFLFPADARERLNHMEKLAGAAAQAKRKAEALALNPGASAKALGIAEARTSAMRVVPLVVVNQEFGASYDFDGCLVVDARFLLLYLGSGTFVPHSVIGPRGAGLALGSSTLYADQAECVARIEATFGDPPPLRRFVERLEWELSPFPTSTGQPLWVMKTVLREPSADQRGDAARLAALAGF